ncbi:MAG: M23 family metallopeptidase [Deltaproteobacteria bacterium]|nr:M23 family metallopeptidase [Deltaproteobacteria bacterium]
MEKRFLTLFVLTNDASRTRQLKIPVNLLKAASAAFVIIFFVLSFVVFDYARLKGNANELYKLREQNTAQRIELQGFASKMRDMETQIARLNIFDKKLRIIANIEEPKGLLQQKEQLMGIGGGAPQDAEAYLTSPGGRLEGMVKEMRSDMTQLSRLAETQEKSFTELQAQLAKKTAFLASTPSVWPTRGWVTSSYGQRISPFTGLPQMHKGLDIANRMGAPVVAPAAGVVVKVAWESGLGKTVTIRHGYGMKTDYGHLAEIYVRTGQRVRRGDKIAAIGNTGHSTGPHLHYEVSLNGVSVNPNKYILN